MPPCGVPSSVGANRPRSTTPAFNVRPDMFPGGELAELVEELVVIDPVRTPPPSRRRGPTSAWTEGPCRWKDRLDRIVAATTGPESTGPRLEPRLPLGSRALS